MILLIWSLLLHVVNTDKVELGPTKDKMGQELEMSFGSSFTKLYSLTQHLLESFSI